MNLAALSPQWLAIVLTVLLLAAAVEDAVRLRIANIVVLLVLAGAVLAAFLTGPQLSLWQNGAVFIVLLLLGTPMFAAGKLGGGDVKLLAALGLWFDLKGALWMMVAVALAGGVLALLVLAVRSFNWSDDARKRIILLRPGGGIPYGVAIAAGGLIAMGFQRI
ncbi:prepilin peptidase [Sphingomonas daechungensis]|uniref:Prepilin peptidase n=1 Tax=Sphingomonas daechungensis TaxID=1176646 RepID=A0ABX6T1H9_9SPHN|nr:prepilin peptidase [Sphingomonas daechungensis]QNP43063.1 prepilin peptidase [Sphingomonas daechungensis]